MKTALIWMCIVLAFVASGCVDVDTNDDEPTAAATSSTSPRPEATPCALEDASTDPVKVPSDQPVALLTDVRPNADGCPRVVLEFRDHVSAYEVKYIEPPITDCGSGEESPIGEWDADAFLSVRIEPAASADMTDENAAQTYTGPRDFDIDGDVLKHLRKSCDFEAVMEWVIALDAEHPFKVDTFEDPARLVIDISGS